jgi:hypothetical protein
MHPYTDLCPLPACLPACPFQLDLGKDDINAHPLQPMSYWLLDISNLGRPLFLVSIFFLSFSFLLYLGSALPLYTAMWVG